MEINTEVCLLLKLVTGEMLITKINDMKTKSYEIEYPLIIVPVQQGSIGFAKFLPFSDYKKKIGLNIDAVVSHSEPDDKILEAYTQQITQLKAQESGIIIPQGNIPKSVLKDASAQDFGELNT